MNLAIAIFTITFGYWLAKCFWRFATSIRKWFHAERALLRFPSEPSHWLLGDLANHPGICHDGLMRDTELVAKYPRCYVFRIGPVRSMLALNHPDIIRDVMKHKPPKQMAGGYSFTRSLMDDCLLLASGKKWKRQHKLLATAFTPERLKAHLTVFNKCTDTAIEKIQTKSVDRNAPLDSRSLTSLLSLDILLQTIFSTDDNVQSDNPDNPIRPFIEAEMLYAEEIMNRVMRPYLYLDTIYNLTSSAKRTNEYIRVIQEHAMSQIERRRAEHNTDSSGLAYQERKLDTLDKLLLARDEEGNGLTTEEIRNEVDNLLANRDSDEIEWADLAKLEYLTMCIKETMRIHPLVCFLPRQTDKPMQIDGKWVPEDTLMLINIWNLHHNPNVWTDPMVFDPERFNLENSQGRALHAYMPFSMGERSCIGKHFAMNEMKTVLARLVHRFEFTIDPAFELRLTPGLILRAETDIPILFKPRCERIM